MEWGLSVGVSHVVGRAVPQASAVIFHFSLPILLLPALGGLLSAAIVLFVCPDAVGHGTNAMTRAFHRFHGVLGLRGPVFKAIASVLVISFGGSAGPEGPIVALGAALGSTCGRLFGVTPAQRRTLLIAGCAAGVGAIFRCPLGGALFAVSIPYSEPDHETDAIVPAFIASVAGYSVYLALWGQGEFLLEGAQQLVFSSPLQLLPFLVLGPLCGLLAMFFGASFRLIEHVFSTAKRLPRWSAPVLGGLLTGVVACFLPQVMDARYEFLQAAFDRSLFLGSSANWWSWAAFFAAVTLAKCLATGFTVGSGAAGGVLGPTLAVGGAAGACLGALCEALFPEMFPELLRQALIPVGMGGVLAASMRVPLAAVVMTIEITGCYGLIVPTMIVCISSYVIGRRWGLNDEQVRGCSESPVHAADTVVRLLESTYVSSLIDRDWSQVIPPQANLRQIVQKIQPGQLPTLMVVQRGQLEGVISLPDLDRVLADDALASVVIAHDIMTEPAAKCMPDQELYHALELFRHVDYAVLPVVSRKHPTRFLGILEKRKILDTLFTHITGLKELALSEHKGLLEIDQETRLEQLLGPMGDLHGPQIQRLMVPLDAVGQSVRQSDFRNRYGVQIVAIEYPDGTIQCPADPNARLEASHRLLVIMQSNPGTAQSC
jgi:CIC family chloride channel protein